MQPLTANAQQIIDTLAQRYQFSSVAVHNLWQAILNGNGSMAQFNHPEFGGTGQWMQNGMIMTADMFNHALKNKIANLCAELAALSVSQLNCSADVSSQTQSPTYPPYSSNTQQQQNNFNSAPMASLLIPLDTFEPWWPKDLPTPNSTGSQNHIKYAYFASIKRLAIEINRQLTLYDTLDHRITGFSQQQAGDGSITFTSQHGTVTVDCLPIIQPNNQHTQAPIATENHKTNHIDKTIVNQKADIFSALEKLADLNNKGVLTDSEYSAKKAELLARL